MQQRRNSILQLAVATLVVCFAGTVHADHHNQDNNNNGWESLFNGKDLSGWEGLDNHWKVEDGAITGHTEEGNLLDFNSFLVWQGDPVEDFVLTLKYRIIGGNSGIQYRSEVIDEEDYVVKGYQADVDSQPNYTGMLYEEKGRGFLAQRGEMVYIGQDGEKHQVGSLGDKARMQKEHVKQEEWNDYTIIAEGNRMTHIINGRVMSEVIDDQEDKQAMSGIIALQIHQGPPMTVQYKDIQLMRLSNH